MFRDLVLDNPMLVEIRRFFRRMFSSKVSNGANVAALVLLVVFYLVIVTVIAKGAREVEPSSILVFQTGLFSLLLPVMVASSIAGERERRTWEILLVAPVTKAQIVVGKFIACVTGLLIFMVACLIPALICLRFYPGANVRSFLMNEWVSFTFGLFLTGLSLLISARSRTTFAALGVSIGIVFALFGAVPTFYSALVNGKGDHVLEVSYPYLMMLRIADFQQHTIDDYRWSAPLINSAIYIALTVILLAVTTSTVRKMEDIRNAIAEPGPKRGRNRA